MGQPGVSGRLHAVPKLLNSLSVSLPPIRWWVARSSGSVAQSLWSSCTSLTPFLPTIGWRLGKSNTKAPLATQQLMGRKKFLIRLHDSAKALQLPCPDNSLQLMGRGSSTGSQMALKPLVTRSSIGHIYTISSKNWTGDHQVSFSKQ